MIGDWFLAFFYESLDKSCHHRTTLNMNDMLLIFSAPSRVLRRLKDSIRCIGLLLVTFIISYLPIIISMISRLVSGGVTYGPTIQFIAVMTFYGSALCNPLVYIASSTDHRKAISKKISAVPCLRWAAVDRAVRPAAARGNFLRQNWTSKIKFAIKLNTPH